MATWVPVIVAVLSAILAGNYARRLKHTEVQAQRLLELERRVAASKAEIFEPLLEAIGEFWTRIGRDEEVTKWSEKHFIPAFQRFTHWVQIYGSDESVRLTHRYMQAIFNDVPGEISMRLMAELVLAARRELGNPDTSVDAVDIMGMRINDLYGSDGVPREWARLAEPEIYEAAGWRPPWGDRFQSVAFGQSPSTP